eukprot:CAMPEP_0197625498 /NCGR_PEP_ID=MMETSP1338-20131121/4848_1 /TAXON_ID=43686 ORGANISM="Pelagodinium beii, Strain RCC1491" /NCGR_SAMPLE_ID=MMETSP1338 /ASSEMBLY_ACC=CAM_ASM_000754 /LENGTH=882 /DNA_ID=CAMNT_0043195925 /DNA_START=65 /DNA_END=2713 /DNA_ORIENTATION=+
MALSRPSHGQEAQAMMRLYGEPGTLYARCGGIFGVAAFADRCMDMWMADNLLNANQKVTTWHQKAQRCGFKFLVVQIIGNLTGGPQVYSGRPMDVAHKHLNISEDEWCRFMEIFNDVCVEFGLAAADVDDLNALMISMEMDCVVYPGETAPASPPPFRPSGSSLYSRLGGVYPISLFTDRLVDTLIADSRVQIPLDAQKRSEVSLKYLFTELMCNLAGGPEIVTARNVNETKLLIPKSQWRLLIAVAEVAADHMPASVRPSLIQLLQRNKHLIIDPTSGDTDEELSAGTLRVKGLEEAAAGKMLSKEVIAARHAAPAAHVAARRRVHGDPRTLYGKGGGVFGLAKISDHLMEAWMANPMLNGNSKVARWHESQQKSGFKFLVTQIMGYLTGGPQRYTGRPMDEAHKHLAISPAEWEAFMQDADKSLEDLGVAAEAKTELLAILANFQSQCVVKPGEAVPADPGNTKPHSTNPALYHRLGGVYPLAQFVDRLVDLALASNSVHIDVGQLEDTTQVRHASGLKYVLTELVCNGTGGPEVVTSKGFEEAKLGVAQEEWPAFLTLVAQAAEIWPSQHMRNALISVMGDLKADICIGMASATEGPESKRRKKLQDAGFDRYLAEAALEKTGDAEAALALLMTGWVPEDATRPPTPQVSGCPFAGSAGVCPFTGKGGPLPAGHPPVPSAPPAPIEERLLVAARALSERGMSTADIAKMLAVDEAQLSAALTVTIQAGRALNSNWQRRLDELLNEDPEFCCPVSLMIFKEPVIASDGFIYERESLEGLWRNKMTSPMTRESLTQTMRPAQQRQAEAFKFRVDGSAKLLKFASEAAPGNPQMALEALSRATDYLEVLKPEKFPALAQQSVQLYQQLGKPCPPCYRAQPAQ